MHLVKTPLPPLAPLLLALQNQPLDLVHSVEEVPQRLVEVEAHLGELLLERQAPVLLDLLPQAQGPILVAVVHFLGQSLHKALVPHLQVRHTILMRTYLALCVLIASTETNPPPVTTGTSTPAYSVFNEKDPSNPTIILQYQTITATPAYRGTSLEVAYLVSVHPSC